MCVFATPIHQCGSKFNFLDIYYRLTNILHHKIHRLLVPVRNKCLYISCILFLHTEDDIINKTWCCWSVNVTVAGINSEVSEWVGGCIKRAKVIQQKLLSDAAVCCVISSLTLKPCECKPIYNLVSFSDKLFTFDIFLSKSELCNSY
jgi:hypothetical protein